MRRSSPYCFGGPNSQSENLLILGALSVRVNLDEAHASSREPGTQPRILRTDRVVQPAHPNRRRGTAFVDVHLQPREYRESSTEPEIRHALPSFRSRSIERLSLLSNSFF